MAESLYQRLGGSAGIAALVDEVLDRHAVNPLLAARLQGKDLPQLKLLGLRCLCAGAGGPPADGGHSWLTACTGLRLSEQEMQAAIADIAAAMQEQGLGAAEVGEMLALLDGLDHCN